MDSHRRPSAALDGQIAPLRLELTRSAQNRELLESHFGCRVRFKADRNALVFRSGDLDRPFVTHNDEFAGGESERSWTPNLKHATQV